MKIAGAGKKVKLAAMRWGRGDPALLGSPDPGRGLMGLWSVASVACMGFYLRFRPELDFLACNLPVMRPTRASARPK